MRFGMVGQTGPGMRQVHVVGFWGIRQWQGVICGANMRRPIVTSGRHFSEFLELQARRRGEQGM